MREHKYRYYITLLLTGLTACLMHGWLLMIMIMTLTLTVIDFNITKNNIVNVDDR